MTVQQRMSSNVTKTVTIHCGTLLIASSRIPTAGGCEGIQLVRKMVNLFGFVDDIWKGDFLFFVVLQGWDKEKNEFSQRNELQTIRFLRSDALPLTDRFLFFCNLFLLFRQ